MGGSETVVMKHLVFQVISRVTIKSNFDFKKQQNRRGLYVPGVGLLTSATAEDYPARGDDD